MQQLALDLYSTQRRPRHDVLTPAGAFGWLHEVHGANSPLAIETVNALFDKFCNQEAFERCKCITLVDGIHAVEGWSWWELADVVGIFTEKDYHTCWDRCWAARQGWPVDKVKRLEVFAYGRGEHTFKEER